MVTISRGFLPKNKLNEFFPPYVTIEFLTAAVFFNNSLTVTCLNSGEKPTCEHKSCNVSLKTRTAASDRFGHGVYGLVEHGFNTQTSEDILDL